MPANCSAMELAIAHTAGCFGRSRRVKLRYHYFRVNVLNRELYLESLSSCEMGADFFIKEMAR